MRTTKPMRRGDNLRTGASPNRTSGVAVGRDRALAEAASARKAAAVADVASTLAKALAALTPPPQMALSDWVEASVVLPSASTAVSGPMRLYKPQREVADVLGNPKYTRVSVLKSARVGYTVLSAAAIVYWASQDPGSYPRPAAA